MKNWAGNIKFQDSKTIAPKSITEIQDIVRTNPKVKARGTAHCFNTIADTKHLALLLDQMPKEIIINKEKKSVTVSAGLKYGEVAEELHKNGWALHNLASLPHISIAGAIATGTHGSGSNNGSLATAVKSFDVVLFSKGTEGPMINAFVNRFFGNIQARLMKLSGPFIFSVLPNNTSEGTFEFCL